MCNVQQDILVAKADRSQRVSSTMPLMLMELTYNFDPLQRST
jgi:hypothetical protein